MKPIDIFAPETLREFIEHLRRVFDKTPWYAELASAVTAIVWSLVAWVSPDDMNTWRSMGFLVRLATDDHIQSIGLFLGAAQFIALISNRRWRRWVASLLMCWFWSLLTVSVWVAVPWAPEVAVYAGWVAVNVCSIMRLLRRNV